jgi:hypothetical protein
MHEAHLYPLWEVAGADGIVRVHVPFSMTDLSQTENRLGSFSDDSASYIKEFKYLTQTYDMTWLDIYVILSSTLISDKKERAWLAAQAHADDGHCTISLSLWDLWLCHMRTHIGAIRTPPC